MCLSLLVIGIDNTILNVALPTIVGDRVGRSADDPAVLAFAGAFMGVAISTMLAGHNPITKTYEQFDDALALLEAGLPL